MKHLIDFNINEQFSESNKVGNCFDSSYDYIMKNIKNPDLMLVHGFVSGRGKMEGYRFAHAWCEDEENVYDNANGGNRTIPKIIYYSLGNVDAKECKYYNREQTLNISMKYRDKGPWEIENTYYPEPWNKKIQKKRK